MHTQNGEQVERLSPWAPYVVQPPEHEGYLFKQKVWRPPVKYEFKNSKVKKPESLRIYECHVGIASNEPKIGTYREFTTNVIPRIVKLGILHINEI